MITTEKSPAGTHLLGFVSATLEKLTELFGHPDHFMSEKKNTEWVLEDAQGRVATVYAWKEDSIPSGDYLWHIGGKTPEVLESFAEETGLQVQTREDYFAEVDREIQERLDQMPVAAAR